MLIAILQTAFVPHIRLLGGGPDLIFLVILAWSINSRLEDSIIWAFIGGIIIDLLSAAPTGTSTPGLIITLFFVTGLGRQVYQIGFMLLGGLVLGGTMATQFTQYIILSFAGFQINWMEITRYVILPTLVYNLVLALPIYWIIKRIQLRIIDSGKSFASTSTPQN